MKFLSNSCRGFFRVLPRILALLLVLIFAGVALRCLSDRHDSLLNGEPVQTVSEFVCEMNGSRRTLQLPQVLGPLPPRTPVTLFAEIPMVPHLQLYVKSVYAPLRLYANDVLVYESGQAGDFPAFLIDPPTRVAIVPLRFKESTVHLRLEFLSPIERQSLALHPLLFGSDISIVEELLHQNGPSLVFSFILLFFGTLAMVTALVQMRGEPDITGFFWLGLFAFATGTWVFGECSLTVFFVPYPSLLYLLSFTGLFTVSIPLVQMGLALPNLRHKLLLQCLSAVLTICTIGALLLQGLGLVALNRSMYLFHFLVPLALSLLSACMLWEGIRYKNVVARYVAAPMLVLTLSAIVELLNYRLRYFTVLSSITLSFQMGALLFVLILSGLGGVFLRDSRRTRAEKQRLEAELKVIERSVKIQKAHYADLNTKIDAAIRYRHDERHHLQSLYKIWESKNYERIGEYLKNQLLVPSPLKRTVLCRNLVIDAVLQFYSLLCKERGVDFVCTVDLPVEMSLSDAELSILWGNLLENAWEAASNPDTLHPQVQVQATYDTHAILIRVENTFAVPPVKKKDVFMSTKHEGRGVGTESVKAVVASHGGQVIFTVEQRLFRVSVLLPHEGVRP